MKKIYVAIIVLIITILSIGQVYGANNTNQKYSSTKSSQSENSTQSKEDEKERKANKYLKSLSIEGYELLPDFNKNTMEYYAIIPEDVTSLEINTEAEVEGAIIRISGNKKLTKKENTISIRVTAIDGTSKNYTITAIKEPEVNLKLSSLEIEGIEITPSFNENTYYYSASIEDTELTSLNIKAVANDPSANIEILGAENIVDGKNLINILLTNDNETTIYQIEVDVDKLGEKEKEKENIITRVRNTMKYATIGIVSLIGLIILLIIISLIVKKCRKKNKGDF